METLGSGSKNTKHAWKARHSEQQVDVETSIGESTKQPVDVEISGSWNSKYVRSG